MRIPEFKLERYFARWELKSSALAGLRVGWIATRDPRLREAAAAFKDYTTLDLFFARHPGNHFWLGHGRRDLPAALEQIEGFLVRRRP